MIYHIIVDEVVVKKKGTISSRRRAAYVNGVEIEEILYQDLALLTRLRAKGLLLLW
jgi:hypothetical protein